MNDEGVLISKEKISYDLHHVKSYQLIQHKKLGSYLFSLLISSEVTTNFDRRKVITDRKLIFVLVSSWTKIKKCEQKVVDFLSTCNVIDNVYK